MARGFFFTFCIALATAAVGLSPGTAFGVNKAEVADLCVFEANGRVQTRFRLVNCFTPDMEEAIWSGVPTTFWIRAAIDAPERVMLRKKIFENVAEHTIRYDLLKNIFIVQRSESPENILSTRDFGEAKTWMSEVGDIHLIPLPELERGKTYKLRVKAELSKKNLPMFFRYILFFVSLWDFETDWHAIHFTSLGSSIEVK